MLGVGLDRLHGGTHGDDIVGGLNQDRIWGDDGEDVLQGGGGPDVIEGGADDDVISGNDGQDQLFGNGGDDAIAGHENYDVLYGGTGNDDLHGGPAGETVNGYYNRLYGEDDRLLLSQLKLDYRPKRGRPERPLLSRPAIHAERFVRGSLEVRSPLPPDLDVLLAQLRRLRALS